MNLNKNADKAAMISICISRKLTQVFLYFLSGGLFLDDLGKSMHHYIYCLLVKITIFPQTKQNILNKVYAVVVTEC